MSHRVSPDNGGRSNVPKDFLPFSDLSPCIFQSMQVGSFLKSIQEVLDVKILELHGLRKNAILDGECRQYMFHVVLLKYPVCRRSVLFGKVL